MKKTVRIALLGLVAIFAIVISSCSGILGGDNLVSISVDGMSGGRYIATTDPTGTAGINQGYVVVMKEDKVYSAIQAESEAFQYLLDGKTVITNLVPGDYIFGIALNGDDGAGTVQNWGLAIKEVTITPGFNDVVIDVAPGLDLLSIGGSDRSGFFAPDGYKVSFANDTIKFHALTGIIQVSVREGNLDGSGTGIVTATSGVAMPIVAPDAGNHSLTITLVP